MRKDARDEADQADRGQAGENGEHERAGLPAAVADRAEQHERQHVEQRAVVAVQRSRGGV